MITVAIVYGFESIVGARTCEDLILRELEIQTLFDAPRSRERIFGCNLCKYLRRATVGQILKIPNFDAACRKN